ncbi:hypothetical protein MWU61_13660 [Loktanella sp. F6476L]|nr:hypothetical protein [Loktanella sp. F6476L]
MTTQMKFTTPAIALVMTAGAASAQAASIDVNGDGMYSFPELQAAMPEITEDAYVVLDVNGDGLLEADEITAAIEAGLIVNPEE